MYTGKGIDLTLQSNMFLVCLHLNGTSFYSFNLKFWKIIFIFPVNWLLSSRAWKFETVILLLSLICSLPILTWWSSCLILQYVSFLPEWSCVKWLLSGWIRIRDTWYNKAFVVSVMNLKNRASFGQLTALEIFSS
jgi:hypothetical protein